MLLLLLLLLLLLVVVLVLLLLPSRNFIANADGKILNSVRTFGSSSTLTAASLTVVRGGEMLAIRESA